jgi:microcompartment protein CcmK/EutM
MQIAAVVGSCVSTIKNEKMIGMKLLIVREATVDGKIVGEPYVAVDTVDAGKNDLVLVSIGSSARKTDITDDRSVDATIVGVIETLEVDGRNVYEAK